MKPIAMIAALVTMLAAQTQDKQPPSMNASISGMVKDAATGRPLADYVVSTDIRSTGANSKSKQVVSTTDQSGRYRLSDLPPGEYRLDATEAQHFGTQLIKRVTLAGRDLEGLDFPIVLTGTIRGKVVDENKEPVPEMTVLLVSKEYYLGTVGYFLKSAGRTNDRGEYKIGRVEAGHPYLILAEKRTPKLPAHSDVPLNPKLRRRVPMRTWYPNSPAKEGAVTVTLQPGEEREGVDIEVRKSPAYCIDGVISTPNGPAPLNFTIEADQPSSGTSSGGGMYMAAPSGVTGPDGKFRICDLYPGNYRLFAMERPQGFNSPPGYYSATTIPIGDRDISGMRVVATTGIDLPGEVVLDGPAPKDAITAKISIFPQARFRPSFGQDAGGRYSIPETFSWRNMLVDDYVLRTILNSPGLYVKDITYADRSVLYESLRLGTAPGNSGLKVIVAQDGATLSVRVASKDGNPVPDIHVLLMPAEVASEAVLAAKLVRGQTDQMGQYTSPAVAPGKYFVVATAESFNDTEESVSKLWRSRNRFTEVVLAPNGKSQIELSPVPPAN